MGNSGSAPAEPPPSRAPEEEVEEQYGVSVAANLVYRLAEADVANIVHKLAEADGVAHPTVESPSDPSKHEHAQPQERPAHINTDKLSELLESQRAQKRAELDAKHAQQIKQEDEAIQEIHNKIESVKATYGIIGKDSNRNVCTPERKELLDCYRNSDELLKCKPKVDNFVECAKRATR